MIKSEFRLPWFDSDTFKLCRKKPQKRKKINFKRAKWDKLNESLRQINWNSLLNYCDADTAWIKFKTKLLEKCKEHIPTITIKSEFQPPWFDSDTFKLCRKKERLRAKYKLSKNHNIIKKYSYCRTDLKNSYKKK